MQARILPSVLSILIVLLSITANAQDQNEAFFAAARKGDAAAVKSLLDKGVDVNAKTRYGATALSYACDRGNVELVKLLLDRGADPNVKDTFYGEVPIGWALSHGYLEVVKLLLEKGAEGKERALTTAVQEGNTDLLKLIVEKGGLKQETLNSALVRAGDKAEIAAILKKAGAVAPSFKVEPETLKMFAGAFKNEQIGELVIDIHEGKLRGKLGGQNWFNAVPSDKNTFAIIEVEATIVFTSENDKITGFTLKQSGLSFPFKRVDQK